MSKLLEKIKKNTTLSAETLDSSGFYDEKEAVSTDVYIINLAFSGKFDGGFKPGLITFAGPSKHFKTVLGLISVRSYLKKYEDSVCLMYDSEFGSPPEYLKGLGIDTSRVIHTPIGNLEQLKFDLVKQLENIDRGDKVVIFIDSIGNLASKKELNDALDQKSVADMQRAKQIKSLWRMCTPYFTMKNIPCININHTYKEISMYPKDVVSGGCLTRGTKIQLTDGSLKPIEEIAVGDYVKTLQGSNKVNNVWDPNTLLEGTPECYEVEMDDGYLVQCSDEHLFLVEEGEERMWVAAKNLKENMNIVSVE